MKFFRSVIRRNVMPLKFSPTILALAALLSAPAFAQYDAPPRPPGAIDYPPGQQPYPDQRPNPDQRYPRACRRRCSTS